MAFNISASRYDQSTITSDVYSMVATPGISSASEHQSLATDAFPSSDLSVSSVYSIVEPSSTRLDDNGTYSASFTSILTSFSSQISLVSSTFTSQKQVSESYSTSVNSSTSRSVSSSGSNMTRILPSQSSASTGSTYLVYHSISSHSSGKSPSQLFSSPTSSLPSLMTISTIPLHWNASSSDSSSSTSTQQSSSLITNSSQGQNSTVSRVPTTTPVLTETPSSSFFPTTTSLPEQTPPSTTSSYLEASSTYNDLDYTVSTSLESIFYMYTQIYKITGSGTTFETGIPTTTMVNVHSTTSSFASPKSTMTEDLDFYQKHLSGGSGSSKGTTNSNNRGKIIGGVIGGVGGFLVCCLLLFLILHWKRRQDKKKVKGFSSEIGRRAGYSYPLSDEDINDEKTAIKENGASGLLAKIKDRSIPPILRRNHSEEEDSTSQGDPFQNEFNFQSRTKARPPLPPPRKVIPQNPSARSNAPWLGVINEPDSVASRDSYISSMSESSIQGDYSTMSSTSIRLGTQGHSNSVSDSSRGFFHEVL